MSRRLNTKHRTNKFTDYELSFDSPVSPETPTVASNPFDFSDEESNEPAADSHINHKDAIKYWSSVSADDNGVLGGYPQVSKVDITGSTAFLAKLRRRSKVFPDATGPLPRAVDTGAGVGRVTKGFLSEIAEVVDIVEPVVQLTNVITQSDAFASLRKDGVIGKIYNEGLESWEPPRKTKYALVWNQWCLGQLTDQQLIEYFERIQKHVMPGGWIVVKENMSTDPHGKDIFDETDSSVTRSDDKFRRLFQRAGLRILATEQQRGMPRELYPVRSYALIPADVGELDGLEEGEEE